MLYYKNKPNVNDISPQNVQLRNSQKPHKIQRRRRGQFRIHQMRIVLTRCNSVNMPKLHRVLLPVRLMTERRLMLKVFSFLRTHETINYLSTAIMANLSIEDKSRPQRRVKSIDDSLSIITKVNICQCVAKID